MKKDITSSTSNSSANKKSGKLRKPSVKVRADKSSGDLDLVIRLQYQMLRDATLLLQLCVPSSKSKFKHLLDLSQIFEAPHPRYPRSKWIVDYYGKVCIRLPSAYPKIIRSDLVEVFEGDGLDGARAVAAVARRLAYALECSAYDKLRRSSDTWPVLYAGQSTDDLVANLKKLNLGFDLHSCALFRKQPFDLNATRNGILLIHLAPILELYFAGPRKRVLLIQKYEKAFLGSAVSKTSAVSKQRHWWVTVTESNFPPPSKSALNKWHKALTAKINLEYQGFPANNKRKATKSKSPKVNLLAAGSDSYSHITGFPAPDLSLLGKKAGERELENAAKIKIENCDYRMPLRTKLSNIQTPDNAEKRMKWAINHAVRQNHYEIGATKGIRAELKKALVSYLSGIKS